MHTVPLLILLALTGALQSYAQDGGSKPSASPELSTLQKQNAVLEEKIKLMTQQRQLGSLNNSDPLAHQRDLLDERIRLVRQEPQPQKSSLLLKSPHLPAASVDHDDEGHIENSELAYTALSGVAATIASELACRGQNIALYGPGQSEELLSVKAFTDQLDVLRSRLKSVLDIQPPTPADKSPTAGSTFSSSALADPVVQSVLDLISILRANSALPSENLTADQGGVIAMLAGAATGQGCLVYWPGQYVSNPFNPESQVMAMLQTVAGLIDNGNAAGKPAGLQQKTAALELELKRAETVSQDLARKMDKQDARVTEALEKVNALRRRIDWVAQHVKDERDVSLQSKLNKSFSRSWEDYESAIRRQLASNLPQTMEGQDRLGEMFKKMELLKTHTDWLAQYVRDEKSVTLQDQLKRSLTIIWTDLEAAEKDLTVLTASIPKANEPDRDERFRWDRYSSDLKQLISTTRSASGAYTAFREALLDGSAGTPPLTRMLRSEALRDLTFDDKFKERPGSSVVELTLQKLGGSSRLVKDLVLDPRKEVFSGGVVLSFVQYEPNGRVKRSGVHTAYKGFQTPQ